MESQNLNSKNFNKPRIPLLGCLLVQENLTIFYLFYSIFTGCQFGLEFIFFNPFFSPGKHFMTWYLLTSANLLIFTIHQVNFVLYIKNLLSIPRTFSSHGDRAFYACASKLWNSLSADLHFRSSLVIFKKTLKTHLFTIDYDSTWIAYVLL